MIRDRILNALIQVTEVTIRHHLLSAETSIIFYGCINEIFYDEEGNEKERHTLHVGDGLQIPASQFYTIEVKEPSILFEAKDLMHLQNLKISLRNNKSCAY